MRRKIPQVDAVTPTFVAAAGATDGGCLLPPQTQEQMANVVATTRASRGGQLSPYSGARLEADSSE